MSGTMTLRQVEELAATLPAQDQKHLVERISKRLLEGQDHFARAQAFLTTCLENPVRPAAGMDAGEEIAAMREERGDWLP